MVCIQIKKQYLQLYNKTNNLVNKWGKKLNRYFTKEHIQSWALWFMPVIPAIQELEVGGSWV
jgi:hypothetical protein